MKHNRQKTNQPRFRKRRQSLHACASAVPEKDHPRKQNGPLIDKKLRGLGLTGILTFRENLAGVIEKMKNITETEAKNTPANAKNSRATDKGKKPDYKQKRSYIKKTTRAEKLYHPKRRECTTQAAKNGMELQKWMQTVGEGNTELRKPEGIG